MMNCEIDPRILGYIEDVESGKYRACKEQHALVALIRESFADPDVCTDSAQLDSYLRLLKYFPYRQLFPWENFVFALWNCTYRRSTGLPRWKTVLCMIGRGAGKDGYIAFDGLAMVSPYNPIKHYNVDVCANNEEQALRPQVDLIDVLEAPKYEAKLGRHYYHTKELIQGRRNRGVFKGHTNNPAGRDGLRPGKIVMNEVHQYQTYDNISVFTTALGKVEQPRIGYFTSNGEVSDGPLDDYLARAERILFEGEEDGGFLPFVCRLDAADLVHDPLNWPMANPSVPFLPALQQEIADEYREWCEHPDQHTMFMPKRMGIRAAVKDTAVTDYAKILATNKPLPDLDGRRCVAGIDYAELSDWAAVTLHFRAGSARYDITHAWVCLQSKTLHRVRAPWQTWAERGLITPVDDVSISPTLLADWIRQQGERYEVAALAMDNFRWTLVAEAMRGIGFDAKDRQRVRLVRPSDIMRLDPVVQECFDRELFSWGDNPCLRWATNNVKRVRSSRRLGSDTGNFYYAKIEAKSRKTDPFMSLAAAMTAEDILGDGAPLELPPVGAIAL